MTQDQVHKEIELFNEWFGSLECENKPEPLRLLMQLAWLGAKEHAAEQGGWISVEERMPEDYDAPVLVYVPYYGVPITAFPQEDGGFADFLAGEMLKKEATHWQPLPALPEKE